MPVPQAAPQSRASPEPVPPVQAGSAVVDPHRPPPPVAATCRSRHRRRRRECSSTTPPAAIPDAAAAQALAERLRGQGFEVIAIRPVPFTIRTGSVRYYFDQDRAAARQLAALSGPLAGSGRTRPPLDFRHYGRSPVWARWRSGLKPDDGLEPDRQSPATRHGSQKVLVP